jgi:hypothetical protein
MSYLMFKNFAEVIQHPVFRVTHEQSSRLVKPGRVGFAR